MSRNSDNKNQNTRWFEPTIKRSHREALNKHKGMILWFTGLSGSGKSTLANALEEKLYSLNMKTYVLDGDNVRKGLCNDLGFSEKDRVENIRRIGEVSNLMMDAGLIVMSAFISPFRSDRRIVRKLVKKDHFIEIFVDAPLDVCESRDVKGLYKKARTGEIKDFTGVSSPYERPEKAELTINTDDNSIENCIEMILDYLKNKDIITKV
ncbi:MAG: adenylyl-sulfate kinase [Legionellales bacterium]|jgi:adenylylsulfate kinase|nr:adenylyl-sulfate kinase [Legionellales bacterium]MBK68430.1 adenylyl-sulfate kinase [Legionellales bacterium]|tara:strand:- start:2456 stop:3079 length:624 start_codon:yes stop_codon:yes gene_type:complete